VVYRSSATNLVGGDTNGADDLFVTVGGIDAGVPTEPRGLTAAVTTAGAAATVDLSWTAPATGGASTRYVIEAGSASGSSDLANFSNGLNTNLRAAIPLGRTFFVRVRAANDAGVSTPSNEVSFTAGGGTPPGPPARLEVNVAHGIVTLMWMPPATGDRPMTYVIQAGSSSGTSNLATVMTRSSETTLVADAPSGTYFVRVLAANSAGTGSPSNEVSFSSPGFGTCAPPQSPPTALVASVSGSTVTLGFGGVGFDPTGGSYVVQAGSAAGLSDLASLDVGPSVPVILGGVPRGTYYLRVRGRNRCGLGPVSNEAVITVS
jgi:predicted phage tail protein